MTFDFLADLLRLQRDWFAADQARTEAAQSGDKHVLVTSSLVGDWNFGEQ